MAFIWGQGGQRLTPEEIASSRENAQRLLAAGSDTSPIGSWTQGLARVLQGVQGGLEARGARKADEANRLAEDEILASLFSPSIAAPAEPQNQYQQLSPSDGVDEFGNEIDVQYSPVLDALAPQSSVDQASPPIEPAPMQNDMVASQNAIGNIESRGSGDYNAIGPLSKKYGRPLGRYQVMEANLPQWSRAALGREVSADEFLANPQIQDAVFDHRFGMYRQKFGDEGAAQAWFGGEGGVGKTGRKDSLGTTIGEYGQRYLAGLGEQPSAQSATPAQQASQSLTMQPQNNAAALSNTVEQALLQSEIDGLTQAPDLNPAVLQALTSPYVSDNVRNIAANMYEQYQQRSDPLYQQKLTGQLIKNRAATQPDAPDAFKTLNMRAQAAGYQPGSREYKQFMHSGGESRVVSAPTVQTFYDPTGREYKAQWNQQTGGWDRIGGAKAPSGMIIEQGPDGSFRMTQGNVSGGKSLTEGQAKDTVYATRAQGAMPVLDQYESALMNYPSQLADRDPTGLVRGRVQSPEYQMARQAGDEFLQAILRKDTGAAITLPEQQLYGVTYLPQPGDGQQVIAQKRQARRRALEAMKAGMPPSAIVQQELAIRKSSSGIPNRSAANNSKPAPKSSNIDVTKMSDEELRRLIDG